MTASAKTIHNHSWVSRLIVSLTIGLMMLALGAASAFAGTGIQGTHAVGNAAPVISAGAGQVTLDEDDEDDEDDGDDEESGSGGGGLPATDTAPLGANDGTSSPIPAIALLVIAGLAGGAVKVAAKRSI